MNQSPRPAMTYAVISAAVIAVAAYVYLLFRISSFRKDQPEPRPYFGSPLPTMRDVLSAANYTEPGIRLRPWLIASMIAVGVVWIAALSLLI
jgi:hypothetical protein